MLCVVQVGWVQRENSEHGYGSSEGNPIPKEGRIRIHKQTGGVGFVTAMRMGEEERGGYCNAVGI
jgi:hypothetical protein